MKKKLSLIFLFFIYFSANAQQQQWHLITNRITTPWAQKVDPKAPLPEYPRPQLVRGDWQNLNGLWSYAIIPKNQNEPTKYEGQILVPFAVESALSGTKTRSASTKL